MQLIANGTQVASVPTPATAIGTPGYGSNTPPGPGVTPTIWDADVANALIAEVANVVTASGQTLTPGTFTQLLQAIRTVASGRILNVQMFTTQGATTYTPTAGTTRVRVTVKGGGGAGGGAASTSSGQYSVTGGGSAGSFGQGLITSGFSGVTVTVGAGGVGAAGTTGGNGGQSSFGAIIVAPGGLGGASSVASGGSLNAPGGAPPANATGGSIMNIPGQTGGIGSGNITAGIAFGGVGGSGHLGNGGVWGQPGTGFGAGGGGLINISSSGASTGWVGSAGFVMIEEFS